MSETQNGGAMSISVEQEQVETPADHRFGQVMLLYVICLALVIVIGSPLQALSLNIGLAVTLLALILAPAIAFTVWKKVPVAEGLRLRPVSPIVLLLSVLYGVGGLGIAVATAFGLQKLGIPSFDTGLGSQLDSLHGYLLTILAAAVLPGICEEALFRGTIQGVLERRGQWFGLLLTALLFGVFHMDPVRAVAAAVLGAFCGWLVLRTGSIIPAMVAHFANNAATLSVSYYLGGYGEAPRWLLPAQVFLFVVAAALVFIVTRTSQASLVPSPLSKVSAGISAVVAWGCGIPAALSITAIFGIIFATAWLLPSVDLEDGSRAMIFKTDSPTYSLVEGQRYVFDRDGKSVVGKATTIDGDNVTMVLEDGTEWLIGSDEIKGAVVYIR